MWHPFIAVGTGLFIVLLSRVIAARRPSLRTQRLAYAQMTLFVVQIIAGAFNVALLAPVWMQLVHLGLAVSVWITLVLLGASAFAEEPETSKAVAKPVMADRPARP